MKFSYSFFTPILLAVLCAITDGSLWSADVPTAEEWAPVETAIAEEAHDAEKRLLALVAAYPRWADGQRALAEWRLHHGNAELALADAQAALEISPNDAGAASLLVQALGKVGRANDAFAIADKFIGEKDPGGWVNFRAAEAAFNNGDNKRANLYLSLANGRIKKTPPEFSFLDARISEASNDLDRAEVSLNRAVSEKPRFWVAFYQLGVVNLRQAQTKTANSRLEYLTKSAANFEKVLGVNRKDALAWLGLGRAQLTLAQDLMSTDPVNAKAKAREAEGSLRNAVDADKDLRDAHLNLGVVLLINEKPESAVTHLLRARELGATNRTVNFNLMLAYQKLGQAANFEAEAKNVQAVSVGEKLTAGIGFYKAGNYALAAELLNASVTDLDGDRERTAATYRFIGHAEAALAEIAIQQDPVNVKVHNTHLDNAREAWRKAGSLSDYPARHFFMAQETARSPQLGYDAGWQHLHWNGYLSLDGWKAVTGNYGGAMTGGLGIIGMWQRHPIHLAVWILLGVIPLCLTLASWLRPKREEEEDKEEKEIVSPRPQIPQVTRQPQAQAIVSNQKLTPVGRASHVSKPAASMVKPQSPPVHRTPIPSAHPPAAKSAAHPPATKPVPMAKRPTPKPQVRSQIETEATTKPTDDENPRRQSPPKNAPARNPTSEMLRPNSALERNKKDPGTDSALVRKRPHPDK